MSLAEQGKGRENRRYDVVYSDEVARTVCERVEAGGVLSKICLEPGMPAHINWYRWVEARPELRAMYVRAIELRTERFAEQIVEIADDSTEDVNRSRLRVEARKWIAAKLLPRKYGDRIQAELGRPGEFEAVDSARLIAEQIALRLGGKVDPKLIEGKVEAED